MNPNRMTGAPDTAWTPGRWVGVTALLAALHAGAFWLGARFPQAPRPAPADPFRWVWSADSPDALEGIVLSPTRFALPGSGGFSGDAARALPPVAYGWGLTEPRPSFLAAETGGPHLGPAPAPPMLPDHPTAPRTPPPGPEPVARMTRDSGWAEPAGGLASRRLVRPPTVPAWTEGDSPQPTRIELAVDPLGQVLTARILAGSGSRPADLAALDAARAARFEPLPGAGRSDLLQADRLTWGVLNLHPAPGVPGTASAPTPTRTP